LYNIGDLVVHQKNASRIKVGLKFAPKYLNPYRIVISGNNRYIVEKIRKGHRNICCDQTLDRLANKIKEKE